MKHQEKTIELDQSHSYGVAFRIAALIVIAFLTLALTPTPETTASTPQPTEAATLIPGPSATPLSPILEINPRKLASYLLPRLLEAILILVFVWGTSILTNRLILGLLKRVHSQVRVFTSRLIYSAMWIGAILWILSVFEVQVATLAAIIGTLGLALSLASQDLAKNFIAGIYLIIEHPFRVGDVISYGAYVGKVEFIDLRTTIISTEDNQQIIIPNSLLLSQVVTRKLDSTVGDKKASK
jgi:small-conductance mechanosensitive channel